MPSIVTTGIKSFWNGSSTINYVVERSRTEWSRSAKVTTPQHALRRTQPHIFCPPTPFSAERFERRYGDHVYADIWGYRETGCSDSSFVLGLEDYSVAADFPALRSLGITRALAALKEQDVNYAQAFAERRQTANLVASSAKKLAKGLIQLKKGNVKGFSDALGFKTNQRFKGVQRTWLELQYGWKPLLGDVYGATKDLFEKDKAEPKRYIITVRGSARDTVKQLEMGKAHDTSIKYDRMIERVLSSRTRLDYCQDHSYLAGLSSGGFTNPQYLAWELLPWSFVADWFIPIGDYLNVADAALGYNFLGGSSTDRYEHACFVFAVYRYGSIVSSVPTWRGYGHSLKRKRVQRRVHATSPMPRFPGFKNPFSLTHAANAIALLGQAVK